MAKLINHADLVSQFEDTEEVLGYWRTSNESYRQYRGKPTLYISGAAFDALERLAKFGGVPSEAFHKGAQRLALAVTALAKAWILYTDQAKAQADVSPSGSPELWSLYEQVRAACKPIAYRKPEPIEQLIKRDRVEAWQVAKMYGWKDEGGNDDVTRVQEELEKPGTHYDAATWKHPDQLRTDLELAGLWAKRVPAEMPAELDDVLNGKVPPTVAPESLELLIQQRVPLEQIARMKQISVEDVERAAANVGVVLQDARHLYPASPVVAMQETLAADDARHAEFERDQQSKAAERKTAISTRVAELKKAGKSGDEINAVVKAEFPQ